MVAEKGEMGEAGTLSVTLQKYIVVSIGHLCFFTSLKMFLCGTNPSSIICFSFTAHIVEGVMSKRSQKKALIRGNLLPNSPMSVCFLALLILHYFLYHLALVLKHSSPSSHLLLFLWCSVCQLLNFSKISILKPFAPHLFFFFFFLTISTISFMVSLIGSVVNPLKPCTTFGHDFLQQEFTVLGWMFFCFFFLFCLFFSYKQ